jgi:Xaa-Pro aminopeptidase
VPALRPPALGTGSRHDLHGRADDQRRPPRNPRNGDGWTIKTKDRSLSAQWEHTVLVTETGFEVLTVSPGMPAPPAFIQNQAASPA